MRSTEQNQALQGFLTEQVMSSLKQAREESVKLCQVLGCLNPAATNWLEPSQSHTRGGVGAITTPTAYTKQWEGNTEKGLGLQHRVTGSSHKVRIAGWAKLQTAPAFQSHAPSFTFLRPTQDSLYSLTRCPLLFLSVTIYSDTSSQYNPLVFLQPHMLEFKYNLEKKQTNTKEQIFIKIN